MLIVRPDYYDDFHCIADKCRHSCCKGWEIDIDDESLQRFRKISGSFGKKLQHSISTEPSAHFILREDERCPFLLDDGLCEMILTLGEDSLCEICTEHPRFYNSFPDRLEMGLGACCEEVARLIVEGKESVRLIYESDAEEEPNAAPGIFLLRDNLFELLSDASLAFTERIKTAAALFGLKFSGFRAAETAAFYSTLERMDEKWTELLKSLESFKDLSELFCFIEHTRYERITEYFLYRYFCNAVDPEDASARFSFALLSTEVICALELCGYADDALRLYSSEIEYSDENVDLILDAIKDGKLTI